MMTILQSIRKHKLSYALFFVIFYQVLCALQGFDLSDEGWGMYFYQQIFKNPECVVGQMPYWVTGVIGGLWNLVFPMGGFLGTRVLGIIMVTGTFYLSYVFLKKSINSEWLLVGLIAQVMIVAGDPKPYGYNSLTAFLVLLSIMFFWRGLEKHKLIWLFIGGAILGINVFVRLPNLAILPIILLIPSYFYWKEGKKNVFSNNQLWVAIIGVIFGLGIIIAAMYYWGYWNLFIKSLTDVANVATDDNNSHQLGQLFVRYVKNYWGIVAVGMVIVLLGGMYVWLRTKISNKMFSWGLNLLVVFILTFASLYYNKALRHNDMYFAQFISYVGTILILANYNKSKNLHLRYAALASLIMIICMPLGSDLGINTMWTSAWMALPLATAYLYSLFGDKMSLGKRIKSVNRSYIRSYFIIIFLVYIGCGIYKNDNLAYYDPGSRFEKIYPIDNTFCRLIYTNSYRAGLMNELLPVLEKYVNPNDYLLVYNFMPGLNYMTNTRSYISNSWLWCLAEGELKRQLDAAVSEGKPLPVVVRHHFVAANRWHPYDPHYADVERTPINILSRPDQTKAINDFLKENHYVTVWTNRNFEVLLPDLNDN